jgi:hypothetical protein
MPYNCPRIRRQLAIFIRDQEPLRLKFIWILIIFRVSHMKFMRHGYILAFAQHIRSSSIIRFVLGYEHIRRNFPYKPRLAGKSQDFEIC